MAVASGLIPGMKGIKEESNDPYPRVSEDDELSSVDSQSHQIDTIHAIDNNVYKIRDCCWTTVGKYADTLKKALYALLLLMYTVYFGFAVAHSADVATGLIAITAIVLICLIYIYIRDNFGDVIWKHCLEPTVIWIESIWPILKWFVYPGLVISTILYLCLEIVVSVRQLQSISGIIIFICFSYFTSKHPDRVRWRPVIWGFSVQFVMAILVLRWEAGYNAVQFLADEITRFINFAYDGAATMFGDPWMVFHPFAFMGMSVIVYMGAVLSILYYLGVTQVCAAKMAWLMQRTMGTTAIETLGVCSNIFLNGMDTMLMLRCYLDRLTSSEFHCFLVGGHATVAGFIFGLFVLFGAPPQHLLSAAVMSAPAVIALSKLNYPETEISITEKVEDVELLRGPETNIFEAAASGCAVAGKTVAAVVTNFIAFLALLAWINAVLGWLGRMVGYDELSFELICSYLFWPVSLIMGVDVADCREVSKLIGIKIFTSEILAYQELGISNRAGLLSERSRAIATYALCGFSSFSTLAMAVGIWNVVCPSKTKDMSSQLVRAITNANMACFMTASIAGLMYNESVAESAPPQQGADLIMRVLSAIPSYRDLMGLVGM